MTVPMQVIRLTGRPERDDYRDEAVSGMRSSDGEELATSAHSVIVTAWSAGLDALRLFGERPQGWI